MGTNSIRATAGSLPTSTGRQSSVTNIKLISCDIYCGRKSKAFNISARAFSITIDKRGQVLLKNLNPKSWISVQYGDQEPDVRTLSTWIIFPFCEKGVTIKVAEQLKFRAIVPRKTSPLLALMETQKPI